MLLNLKEWPNKNNLDLHTFQQYRIIIINLKNIFFDDFTVTPCTFLTVSWPCYYRNFSETLKKLWYTISSGKLVNLTTVGNDTKITVPLKYYELILLLIL